MERLLKVRRIEALRHINELTASLPLIVTCAATSRELASVENRRNHFYVLDSMGLVGSIATGLALAAKDSSLPKVVGLEGDGSLLMNPNVLQTGGFLAPEKLFLIILDNHVYGSTGSLPTYSDCINLGAIAEVTGWSVGRAGSVDTLHTEYTRLMTTKGPALLHVRIEPGNASEVPKLLVDPVTLASRFKAWFTDRLEPGCEYTL